MTLAQLFKKQRKKQRLTVDELAAMTGYNRSHIYRLEAGTLTNPTLLCAGTIAQTLGLSMDDVYKAAISPRK